MVGTRSRKQELVRKGDQGHGIQKIKGLLLSKHIKFDDDGQSMESRDIAEPEDEPEPKETSKEPDDENEVGPASLVPLTLPLAFKSSIDDDDEEDPRSTFRYPVGKSIIETLPVDVIWAIFKHLCNPFESHCNTANFNDRPQTESAVQHLVDLNKKDWFINGVITRHPFLRLVLVSSTIRDKVESCCEHLTKSLLATVVDKPATRMKAKNLNLAIAELKVEKLRKKKKRVKQHIARFQSQETFPVVIPNTVTWLKLSTQRCLFCGKSTLRRAIFAFMTWCCRKCDDEMWPKLRRKDALQRYIMPIHLDCPYAVFPGVKPPTHAAGSVYDDYYLKKDVGKIEVMAKAEDPFMMVSNDTEKLDIMAGWIMSEQLLGKRDVE